ncbi:uncharacterized protein BP5553_00345 [Venustampulla echinocandica]|uniref:Uncharacterized protein n=1 Tax=Venustampulla echinocandica TaxID=2656787 RepID=A0A370TXV1_9HELO|nr:uncharacterized protein BP5553_00345 [Venustampulla echinocandica]RDL40366.1 hypothetical protein BP5553_00345 [Venustampulla echinocandica]
MHLHLSTLGLLSLISHALAQGAVGGVGAIPAPTPVASQYPTITTALSLVTINGVTSAQEIVYTIPFATTALGTWELGPTPRAGSIGLGDIAGKIGVVKSKRGAVETAVS